jgi:phosphopantothenate synthetase
MENVTLAEFLAAVLAIASGFLLLANAAEKIVKAYKAWKAPAVQQNDQQNKRLDALEVWREKVDDKLNNGDTRMTEIEKGDRAAQRALLALLDHGIDGNNIKQMQAAKEELQNHLINR